MHGHLYIYICRFCPFQFKSKVSSCGVCVCMCVARACMCVCVWRVRVCVYACSPVWSPCIAWPTQCVSVCLCVCSRALTGMEPLYCMASRLCVVRVCVYACSPVWSPCIAWPAWYVSALGFVSVMALSSRRSGSCRSKTKNNKNILQLKIPQKEVWSRETPLKTFLVDGFYSITRRYNIHKPDIPSKDENWRFVTQNITGVGRLVEFQGQDKFCPSETILALDPYLN